MKKIDKNDPYFIPYIKGYGTIDDYYVDWMGDDEPFHVVRHIIKDFQPVSQIRWYDENKLLYNYESSKC